MKRRIVLVGLFVASMALACGKGEGGDGEGASSAAPAKPANGSPVAAEFVEFKDGKRGKSMEVRLYNFGPKVAAGYMLLAKYTDKDGKPLKVKPGTAFEKDHDFTSLSGGRYAADPGKWTAIDVEMFEIPADAVKAEVVISKVSAAKDGKIEDWWSQKRFSEWPSGDKPAGDGDEAAK